MRYNPNSWDLQVLQDYSADWDIRDRRGNLLHPHPGIWPDDGSRLSALLGDLLQNMGADEPFRRLFCLSCLAAAILAPERRRPELTSALSAHTSPSALGLPFLDWDHFRAWRWAGIPLVLSRPQENAGEVRWAMVGFGEKPAGARMPLWASSRMDATACRAVETAAALAAQKQPEGHFFFWPVLDPCGSSIVLHGSSLGLAVYLGFRSAQEGFSVPALAATGALSADGDILPVEGILQKCEAAHQHRLAGILCPAQTHAASLVNIGRFECLRVGDLETAEILWRFHAPGTGSDASAFLSPHLETTWIIDHLESVPAKLLSWLEADRRIISLRLPEIVGDPSIAKRFVRAIEALLDPPDWSKHRAQFLLDLVTPELVDTLGRHAPGLAFRLCKAQVACANHCGAAGKAAFWLKAAQSFQEAAVHMTDGESLILQHACHRIGQAHNRFEFDPRLAEHLPEDTRALIERMEGIFAERRRCDPLAVNHDLGSFYGTMAQNAAFCGPEHLPAFEGWISKALDAFGAGLVQEEAHTHWLRDVSYKVYAYLDAGLLKSARTALLTYLKTSTPDTCNPRWNPYQHAALMRWLADTEEPAPAYLAWACKRIGKTAPQHPWQLWLYNLGRSSVDPSVKEQAWMQSLQLCKTQGEETVNVMGLLPLAALHADRLGDPRILQRETGRIRSLLDGPHLSRRHFACLLDTHRWEKLLETVIDQQAALFPFSYR
ncbi:hypothetical protein TRIP_B330671 [uncultured Desulfatiglans sp.]|nr:hypothetical protein TRIP_B330671 [uncultured Desulfatiglans sp.]